MRGAHASDATILNLFILSEDPVIAARMQCNAHITKMPVETAQLLVTAFPNGTMPYRHTHTNNPCALWVRESLTNYRWAVLHGLALCEEYTRRYGRVHATQVVVELLLDSEPELPNVGLTPFARAIKQPWKDATQEMDIVTAYRRFYVGDKARFARWKPKVTAPDWWPTRDA